MLKTTCAAIIEEQSARFCIEPDHADKKAQVADARSDEGFLRCGCGIWIVVPEADEEIGGEADDLPAHEEEEQAVGDNDAQHGSGKERQKAEEAREVFVVGHVADAVDKDEQTDE